MPRQVKEGPDPLFRKIIRITGMDSPNVRYAEQELKHGFQVSHTEVVPGVLSYQEYLLRLATWDDVRKSVGIFAQFYRGASVLMFPPDWLNRAEARAAEVVRSNARGRGLVPPVGLGVDPAEGGDDCVWTVADALGFAYQEATKTPDTSVIVPRTLALMREYEVRPENVVFDRGGGGKQHADLMERDGYPVRSVGFGEVITPPPEPGFVDFPDRVQRLEERYAYKNRRAQLYGELRERLDPGLNPVGYGLPAGGMFRELRRQLAPIPLTYDPQGRLYLIPKTRPPHAQKTKEPTLTELLGCSPDEADSAVLALHAVLHPGEGFSAGGW